MNKNLTMYKPLLLWFILTIWSIPSFTQDYRSIDGTQNNLTNTGWGAAHHPLVRSMSNGYADGISEPGGTDRPNPRLISNLLFAQNTLINDPLALSDYIWVFGQFIDHDLVSVEGNPTEPAHIPVDFDDPQFNPSGTIPGVIIPMFRSNAAEGTGTDVSNPRNHLNEITSWIDGSAVYGSDLDRANWLRTFNNGLLKTSTGNLLPYNTTTGEFDDPVDATAPFMADDVGFATRLFVAGDIRANEQPLLLSCHTLFVREHNRLCEELLTAHPDCNDEELYQHARKIVGALIQAIVYEEWLPSMGVQLPAYSGYSETTDGSISNVFSAAAFRLGHTLLNGTIQRLDANGEIHPEGNLTLQHAFFNPSVLDEVGGLDPYFKGMATQIQQDLDCKVIDDVRNFLFGPPGSGGLDLAAININRGRERGLPDFNQIRQDLGLTPYATFEELNPDTTVSNEMASAYSSIDDIDPWVGMLAEYHMPNALFGETVMKIMERQFGALRDGDRFYYENDPILSEAEKNEIKHTTFRMIIRRNTDIELMQANVFSAMPHDSICNPLELTGSIGGEIADEGATPVGNVSVEITDIYNASSTTSTAADGLYNFPDLGNCTYYRVSPTRDGDDRNGVGVLDLVLISRHLIGLQTIASPYKMIAADIDKNGILNTFDIVGLQRLLLFFDDQFTNNSSWRFIDADYTFSNPLDPLAEDFPEYRRTDMLDDNALFNFVGVKIGDLNGSADPAAQQAGGDRAEEETLLLETADQAFSAGEIVNVNLAAADLSEMLGYQFTLGFDAKALEFVDLKGLSTFGRTKQPGELAVLWNCYTEEAADLNIQFRALTDGHLSEVLHLSSNALPAKAYDQDLAALDLALSFSNTASDSRAFQLINNQPNPFFNRTQINWITPQADAFTFRVLSATGEELLREEKGFEKGLQRLDLDGSVLPGPGVYFYVLSNAKDTQMRKLIYLGTQ